MTAISTRQHEKLIGLAHATIAQAETGKRQHIDDDMQLLQQIHDRYQAQLSLLRRLIGEYDTIQRRVRMGLRKQQIEQTRQKQCT